MATPARVMEATRFTFDTSFARNRAIASFKETRRRHRVRTGIDTIADAALATGGLVVANAAMHFGMGLPEGRNGIAIGGTLLAAATMWLTRTIRSGGNRKDPAASAAVPLLIPDVEPLRRAA